MDNQQEKQEDVYEAYVDASVALFMKYYCDILDEGVANSNDLSAEGECIAFPEDLDKRCRSLIMRAVKRQKIREGLRIAGKAFLGVCRVAVACLALISVLFVTVEAVRVPIINFFIEHSKDSYLEIKESNNSKYDMSESFDPANPLAGILTDEYQLVAQDVASEYDFSATYIGADDSQVYIKARPISNTTGIDLEGADNYQKFQINNCEAYSIEENNRTRVMWIHEEKAVTFTLIVIGSSDLDAIYLANQIMIRIS